MKLGHNSVLSGNAFEHSSAVYDLLYAAKDYAGEARFVHELIRTLSPHSKSILDLGCGTGRHAQAFVELGYNVTGVDASANMLCHAAAHAPDATLSRQDIRDFDLGKSYDVVVSLFHVFSYLLENADLQRTVQSISRHAHPGTLLVFDAWYGPGVLCCPPEARSVTVNDGGRAVARRANPRVDYVNNQVEVTYELTVDVLGEKRVSTELHSMRYYFSEDIEPTFQAADFELLKHGAWLTDRLPMESDWNVYWVFRKK